ncbi:hypothetical protein [Fodinicola feengrottensis]|nr:hypothetical protein [Fodinicola feengrottensis]
MEIWVAVVTGVVALLAAFVGVIGTLVGALVADRGARRREEDARKERRNETVREMYGRFLSAAAPLVADRRDPDRAATDALLLAATDFDLLVPAGMASQARQAVAAAERLGRLLTTEDRQSPAVTEAVADLRTAVDVIRDAMRADLAS